jgi:hypothetical protein
VVLAAKVQPVADITQITLYEQLNMFETESVSNNQHEIRVTCSNDSNKNSFTQTYPNVKGNTERGATYL